MSPPVVTPLLVVAVLAWRILVTFRDAHEASRRWSFRTALPWALLLLSVDAVLIAVMLVMPVSPTDAIPVLAPASGIVEVIAAAALSGVVRHLPVRGGHRRTSLRRFVMARIEQAAYDQADEWIYSEVYPTVTARQMKPLLNAIRGYLESQPTPQGSLDASYVANLIHAGRTPSREDLRAACHRMLVRHGRRRLVDLIVHYGRSGRADSPRERVAAGGRRSERAAVTWITGAVEDVDANPAAAMTVYIESDDQDSAQRVIQAAEAMVRVVGDTERE